ncbi:MAG: hypothetical protein IPK26_07275 [Planctomycetes bacterium]|nr:hypothetical protein [Planctomycetota bacterium]
MGTSHERKEAGFTFAELAFGLLVMVIAAAVLINHLTVNYQTTLTERDRVFAYSRAQAILAEIQGFVDRGQVDAAVDLDVLDDGIVNKDTLSIATDSVGALVAADHVLSGNYRRDGDWVWSRRITVQPFAGLNNRNVRYVTVRVYRRDNGGNDNVVAELSAVINSAGSAFPTTQVFDIYLLAVENIPGWWVYMDSIRPFVESTITDLETRNPGLQVRTHWITKASFGRNPVYRPYVNEALGSWDPLPQTYVYPGKMPTGNASTYYYVPDNMRARINLDGTEAHGHDSDLNPHPYALADFFNHAMRYPDELALWQQRVDAIEAREDAIAAAVAAGTPPPAELDDMSKEPTLRLFLEDLYSSPDRYKNALIINLHGELLPMPALRNVSDPARDPEDHSEVRVVTHPEELRTARGATTSDVNLRVYAFNSRYTTGASILQGTALGQTTAIVVDVLGMKLVDGAGALRAGVEVRNLPGGVTVNGSAAYPATAAPTAWPAAKTSTSSPLYANEMYYTAEYVDPGVGQEKYTRFRLYNTPLGCARDTANRGLYANQRSQLYQMSYIPCPVEAARDFSKDLRTVGDGPKNSARWRITVPATSFGANYFVRNDDNTGAGYDPAADVRVRVRTFIEDSDDTGTPGTMWPPADRYEPENLSVTYTWWADSAEDVPITERYQFQGDPRHCPYKDLFNNTAEDFPNGYNWYHDNLNNGVAARTDFPSIEPNRLGNRWLGRTSFDLPRMMEVLRKGLVKSGAVYTSLSGFSYYYVGIGNDIGYDSANGYPNSIPCDLAPFGTPGSDGYINTITGARRLVRAPGAAGTYWVGFPWLGELCPDSVYTSQWLANDADGKPIGNLVAGTASGEFWQTAMNTAYSGSNRTAYGTALPAGIQNTGAEGCTTFFNTGTAAATFHHIFSSGNGSLSAIGSEIATNYNFTMPTAAPISRPFGVARANDGGTGDHWSYSPYDTTRYTASLFKTYYTHPSGATGSGLVKLTDTGATSAAYVVVNGIDATVESGSSFIAKWAVLSLVHSFFEAGSTTNTLRIKQLPRVEILSPTDITELDDPAEIPVLLGVAWQRWDGLPFSAGGTFSEVETDLDYVLQYSNDGGTTWRYVQDDSVATPTERPAASTYVVADAGSGDETFIWSVPIEDFPEGSYLLHVDCYRRGTAIHSSYHKTKFFIRR